MTVHLSPVGHAGQPNVLAVVEALDAFAELGVRADDKALKPVRAAARRVHELREQSARVRDANVDDEIAKLAREYADGTVDADSLPERVARAEVMNPRNPNLRRVLDDAERVASAHGTACCRELGDRWVALLKPAVERLVDSLTPEVVEAALGGLALQPHDLHRDREARGAVERLTAVLAKLEPLWDFATSCRNWGWMPTPRRRSEWHHADFHYLHHDRLAGDSRHVADFFCRAYLNGAQPGVYTADEVVAANPGIVGAEPTPSTAPADEHVARGGRREVA